jgi:dephospho-CoA kinase
MIIGLTGGLGCGKSTAARIFEDAGFRRIDTDMLVRDHVLTRPEVEIVVAQKLGPQTLTPQGRIDRTSVARVVFTDDNARQWLEDLVHPMVYALMREQIATAPADDWVVEVPLLFEKQLENWFDFTVCVTTTSRLQFARLEERGLPRALAEQRISKQLPLAKKLELADHVLLNDGSTAFLRDQIIQLIAGLRKRR